MTAQGRINAARLTRGDSILVTRDFDRRNYSAPGDADAGLWLSRVKIGVISAVVLKVEAAEVAGFRRSRREYTITTDQGVIAGVAPIQTMWHNGHSPEHEVADVERALAAAAAEAEVAELHPEDVAGRASVVRDHLDQVERDALATKDAPDAPAAAPADLAAAELDALVAAAPLVAPDRVGRATGAIYDVDAYVYWTEAQKAAVLAAHRPATGPVVIVILSGKCAVVGPFDSAAAARAWWAADCNRLARVAHMAIWPAPATEQPADETVAPESFHTANGVLDGPAARAMRAELAADAVEQCETSRLDDEQAVDEWPAGKTFGELTPAQKGAALRTAASTLQAEMTRNASALAAVIDERDTGRPAARVRRPSAAQRPILAALVTRGGIDVPRSALLDELDQAGDRWPGVGTWVAVDSAGWVTVDRGTPDNRGGDPATYRYTLTEAGWFAAGVDQVATGTGPAGPWAIARLGARLVVATKGFPTADGESEQGPAGAERAYGHILAAFRGEAAAGERDTMPTGTYSPRLVEVAAAAMPAAITADAVAAVGT